MVVHLSDEDVECLSAETPCMYLYSFVCGCVTNLSAHVRVVAVIDDQLESGARIVVWAAQSAQADGRVGGHLVVRFRADATHRAEDAHQVVEAFDSLQQHHAMQRSTGYCLTAPTAECSSLSPCQCIERFC